MTLPVQFANLTAATGAMLDENFAALGALTPIPCTAAGSNAIVLTPAANTPAVAAYSDYMQFTFVAAQSNTLAATARVGSLPILSVYKASPSGPVALAGSEIVQNVANTLLYNSALNSGAGGFQLMGESAISFAGGSVSGPIVGVGSLATITYPVGVFPLITGTTLASISRLVVGGGSSVSRLLSTVASITWPSLAPQTTAESIISLAGCSVGDNVMLGYPASIAAAIMYRGYIPNAGSIALVAANISAGTITPTPGNYRTTAMGF